MSDFDRASVVPRKLKIRNIDITVKILMVLVPYDQYQVNSGLKRFINHNIDVLDFSFCYAKAIKVKNLSQAKGRNIGPREKLYPLNLK